MRNEITPQQLATRSVTDRELLHDPYGLYRPYELLASQCQFSGALFTQQPTALTNKDGP